MKSDITRDTFFAEKHFSRVIRQQGRVDVDADSNEQTAILLHYLRTLAVDLIGPYAAPALGAGFRLTADNDSLLIGAGRYYVDGILVENETPRLYTDQPSHPLVENDPLKKALIDKLATARYWLYLDVWERHVTSIEDDSIREKALGGPDTCTRAQVTWQVSALDVSDNARATRRNEREQWLTNKKSTLETQLATDSLLAREKIQAELDKVNAQLELLNRPEPDDLAAACPFPLPELLPVSDASMGARIDPGAQIVNACVISPESKYSNGENQLYRVEIHRGGVAGEATIKWSRDNGSVATAWLGTSGFDVEVADARGFASGNWIELIDDVAELRGLPGALARLTKVEGGTLSVDPDSVQGSSGLHWSEDLVNAKVRRWDHFETEDTELEDDGSILIQETPIGTPDDDAAWMILEHGVQVRFGEGGRYRTGDYWLIPARVATGNIEWPASQSDSFGTITTQVAPHGVVHHYAPLGFVNWPSQKIEVESCNCEFEPLSSCFASAGSVAVGASLLRSPKPLFVDEADRAPVRRAARTRTTTRTAVRRATKKSGGGE